MPYHALLDQGRTASGLLAGVLAQPGTFKSWLPGSTDGLRIQLLRFSLRETIEVQTATQAARSFGVPRSPVATLKVELFHPAFLQGFSPTKRVEDFGEICVVISLVIWQVTSKEKLKETIDGIQHKGQPGYLAGTNLVS